MNFKQGWINLYKPKNISSFQAVNKIKKRFNFKKIGHAGTLDPPAEGILPIALGKATKLIPFLNSDTKTYLFTISWGTQTSTDDKEGHILHQSSHMPHINDLKKKMKNYIGFFLQKPPKVSAVKIDGQRAYKLFRQKKDFKILPKTVYVKNLEILKHENSETIFKIECGSGFYVRSLARDLALDLNTFGHIQTLERTKVGKFNKESSILLDDLLKIGQRQLEINCICPTISMLDDILAYEIVDENDFKDLSFGRSIKIGGKILRNPKSISSGKKIIFLSYKGDVISFGKLNGNLFEPNKILL